MLSKSSLREGRSLGEAISQWMVSEERDYFVEEFTLERIVTFTVTAKGSQ